MRDFRGEIRTFGIVRDVPAGGVGLGGVVSLRMVCTAVFLLSEVLKRDETKKAIGSGGGLFESTNWKLVKNSISFSDARQNTGYGTGLYERR